MRNSGENVNNENQWTADWDRYSSETSAKDEAVCGPPVEVLPRLRELLLTVLISKKTMPQSFPKDFTDASFARLTKDHYFRWRKAGFH